MLFEVNGLYLAAPFARAWYSFLGELKTEPPPPIPYAAKLEAWRSFLRSEAQLAECTISDYGWWIRTFLQWLQQEKRRLERLTVRVTEPALHTSKQVLQKPLGANRAKVGRSSTRLSAATSGTAPLKPTLFPREQRHPRKPFHD